MDQEQKKKWEKKLAQARSETRRSDFSTGNSNNPDLNSIRKKFRNEKEDSPGQEEELQLEPDLSVEDDIDVEVKSTPSKASPDASDNPLTAKKIVITSKSKGILGFNG